MKNDKSIHTRIIESLKHQIEVFKTNEKGKVWQPRWKHAVTWLNQEGWNIEVEVKKSEMMPDNVKRRIEQHKVTWNQMPTQEKINKWIEEELNCDDDNDSLDNYLT